MLEVEALEILGLEPVSFTVEAGECFAVQGPSGSGKTLLLRAIADLDPAPGGVILDGAERGSFTGPAWRKRVRYVAAEPGWWSETARGHFFDLSRASELAGEFGLDEAALDRPILELSTGERQRLALVRCLIDSPPVLLLDEPTGALDAKAASAVERRIGRELKRGAAIILASHDTQQAKRLAKRGLVLARDR